jgi:L-asparaginase
MKRILIIHTGGTFGMTPMAPENTLRPGKIEQDIATHLPELNKLAEIHVEIPFNLDSSNIGPEQWIEVYRLLEKSYSEHDGFIIIHGTDTLVYSATAISFLTTKYTKPIIFTGSQRPLSAIRSDARSNLVNAVELATRDIPEVSVCFDNKLFRANRTKKQSIESYHGFDSPNYPPLARMGLNIQLFPELFLKKKKSINISPKFNNNILIISLFPGCAYEPFLPFLDSDCNAFIINGFGSGNLPDVSANWISFVERAAKLGKSIYIGSQSQHGNVDLTLYECGRRAKEAGAISLLDMTSEAAVVKLMLLSANFKGKYGIEKKMCESIAGEISQ